MIGDTPLAKTPRSPPPWYAPMDTVKSLLFFLQLSPANITKPGPGLYQPYPAFEKLHEDCSGKKRGKALDVTGQHGA